MLAGVGLKSYLGFNNNKSAAAEKKCDNSGRPAAVSFVQYFDVKLAISRERGRLRFTGLYSTKRSRKKCIPGRVNVAWLTRRGSCRTYCE